MFPRMFFICLSFITTLAPAMAETFTFTTSDPSLLAGVEYAREMYCASLPQDDPNNPVPCPTPDVQSYWAFVASRAFQSYAAQQAAAK